MISANPSFLPLWSERSVFRSVGLFLFGLICFRTPALGNAGSDAVHVSISNRLHGSRILEGQFWVAASSRTAWEILTDYDHMAAFISSIKSSRRIRRDGDNWIVEQTMTGHAGIFRKRIHLLLEVNESPLQMISFHDISKKSFRSYSGSWIIQSQEKGIKVRYYLEATPAFFAPDFIAIGAFKRNVANLLEEVRNEIVLRNRWEIMESIN